MDCSNGFAERLRRDVPLAELTWFKLGGAARYMFSPTSVDELRAAWHYARQQGWPVRVLGGGANLLVADEGFDGLVLRLDAPAFTGVRVDGDRVHVGGGADLMRLARDVSYRGFAGLEFLAGIPGTVGGAVRMNAGGKYGAMSDVVESATLLAPDGAVCTLPADALSFGYRHSALGDRIVLEAVLRVAADDAAVVKSRFQQIWQEKKNAQPMAEHCAGCIFKNPPGESAGRLIDQAGLKGLAEGRARVSPVHGNFIVADAGAQAGDVLALIERVRAGVKEHAGVDLELEIEIWSTPVAAGAS